MGSWATYSLSDLVLFSAQPYDRLFVLHNAMMWPLHLAAFGLAVVMMRAALRPQPKWIVGSLAGLGIAWLLTAVGFFWISYASINWAAVYVAPVFAFQGVLLAFFLRRRLRLTADHVRAGTAYVEIWQDVGQNDGQDGARNGVGSWPRHLAIVVLIIAFAGYPLLTLDASWTSPGRVLAGMEVFAIAPDPTAAATLGFLALVRGRSDLLLWLIPLAWCMITGLTLWALGDWMFFLAPSLAIIAVIARMR